MQIKKLILQLHLWLGLSSGLIVFILGVTGCIFCFEKELQEVFYRNRRFVRDHPTMPLSMDSLNTIALPKLGAGGLDRIELRPGTNRTYIYSGNDGPAILYLNPYTGRTQFLETSKWEFFGLILDLHYDLLLGDIGEQLVSWATVVFVIILLTGLVLWWPINKRAARQRYWFQWKKTTNWKRKNYDLHNIPGFYSLLVALLIALTGLHFGFPWFRDAARFVANRGQVTEAPKPLVSDTLQRDRKPSYQAMLAVGMKQEPFTEKFIFVLPSEKEGTVVLRAYPYAGQTTQNNLFFDQYTGKLLATRPYQTLRAGDKLGMLNYDLHTGKILGLPGMIVAFLGSLIAASLPVTGFLIWWGKRKKAQSSRSAHQRSHSLTRPAYSSATKTR